MRDRADGSTRPPRRARAARLAALVGAAVLWSSVASADPLFSVPGAGRLRWGEPDSSPAVVGVQLEARLLGVPGGSRLAAWPDRRLGLAPGEPAVAAIRAGVVAHLRCVPLSLVLAVDAAELARPGVAGETWPGDDVGVVADRIVDDAFVLWRPARAAQLAAGRLRVPWSKWRQFAEADLPLGAAPFLVDRLAPDRRWGALVTGDLGSVAYLAGAWEDLDVLEPRLRAPGIGTAADPSTGGAAALAAHLEWTPRAPMMGSNPPGRVPGALGPMPTPRADPWFHTPRTSLGLGFLWRLDEAGESRLDVALSAHVKWRWLGLLAEGVLASGGEAPAGEPAGDEVAAGVHGTVLLAPVDRVGLLARGEWDGGAPGGGEWTVAGGATWFATSDRRNQVGFLGFWRRGGDGRSLAADGAVVVLQAAL